MKRKAPARSPQKQKSQSGQRTRSGAELPLRITLLHPPAGVTFGIQRGATNLEAPDVLAPTRSSGDALVFDFTVRVDAGGRGQPNFLGPFTHGPKDARFIYVNSGVQAGQKDSRWSRRLKIPLTTISGADVEKVFRRPGSVLEASVQGTGGDGGPSCASIRSFSGWQTKELTLESEDLRI